ASLAGRGAMWSCPNPARRAQRAGRARRSRGCRCRAERRRASRPPGAPSRSPGTPSPARCCRAARCPPPSASRWGSNRGRLPARWRAPRTPRHQPRRQAPGAGLASSGERALREGVGEERPQRPAPLALRTYRDDLEVEPELGEQLAARAARRGGRVHFGGDDDAPERPRSGGHRRTYRHALGADRHAVGRALDVRPHERPPVLRLDRRPDAEPAVGAIRVLEHLARLSDQLRAHVQISFTNDVPAASGATPKYSATVAPISAKLARSPNGAGFTRGPNART